VIDKHVSIVISEDCRVSRAVDVAVASENLGTAAFHHRLARLVYVRTGDLRRAADHSAVSTCSALAAAVKGGPEVEVVAVLGDEGRFDGSSIVGTSGDRGDAVLVDGFAGRGAQLDQLQTAPERAEGEPPSAVGCHVEVGVDGIVVAVDERLDDEAVVGPRAGGTGLAHCEEDTGSGRSKAGS